MLDVISIGEAMVVFNPDVKGPLKFVNNFRKNIGGAELNLVIGCSRLGLKTGFISRLGDDEFGKSIRTFARGEQVDTSELELIKGYPTSIYFKEIMEDGDVQTFYYRDKSPTLTMQPDELNESYIKNARVLHITGIFPAIGGDNLSVMMEAIRIAKKYDVKVSFDPNIRLKMWTKEEARKVLVDILPHVDILLAGDEEMDIIIGEKDPKIIVEKVKEIGIPTIIIKRGENGSAGYHNGNFIYKDPVKSTKVVDTVGAGDGFDAGFLYGYLHDWDLDRSLHFANTIGSMVVSITGDNEGLPFYEDVQKRLGEIEKVDR